MLSMGSLASYGGATRHVRALDLEIQNLLFLARSVRQASRSRRPRRCRCAALRLRRACDGRCQRGAAANKKEHGEAGPHAAERTLKPLARHCSQLPPFASAVRRPVCRGAGATTDLRPQPLSPTFANVDCRPNWRREGLSPAPNSPRSCVCPTRPRSHWSMSIRHARLAGP